MSADPIRGELAGIARGLRNLLEREEALGQGELLARAAATPRGGPPADTGTPPASASPAEGAAPSPPPAPRSALAAETDLFGNPVAPSTMVSPGVAHEAGGPVSVPGSGPIALHSRGLDERAAFASTALPILETIAGEVRECRKCGLCETRTQAVPGVGSATSGIVFVGEAPGADEDEQGEPFVGRAGQLLTKIIQAMDDARLIPGVPLSRETVYICNVLKCRPPENRNPLPHEVAQCAPYLARQLEALKPRVICCLGKFAAELLLGVKGTIAGLRGAVYRYQGAKLIVTYHPAACLRNPGYKRPVWEDMQRLAQEYLTD